MAAASTTDGDVSAFVLQQSRLVALERLDDITTSAAAMQSLSEKDAVKAGLCIPASSSATARPGCTAAASSPSSPSEAMSCPPRRSAYATSSASSRRRRPAAAANSGGVSAHPDAPHALATLKPTRYLRRPLCVPAEDGVVYRQTDRLIVVAIEEYPDVEQRLGSFSLTRLANEVTYQRYSAALKQLQDRGVMGHDSSRPLQVLYGGVAPSTTPTAVSVDLSPNGRHQRLNSIQEAAINQALSSNDVFVPARPTRHRSQRCAHHPTSLHSAQVLPLTFHLPSPLPAHTGKTTTLVELIVQCVARGERVLACAPSNIAVDNLVERITAASAYNASHAPKGTASSSSSSPSFHAFRCIRVGHPARLSPSVLAHSLDSVVAQSDGGQITRDITEEMATTQQSINTTRDRGEKKSLRLQWKALQKELRSRQKKAVKDTLDGCSVTCTTLIGAASSACAAYHYDVVIIDEAAQAIECACLIPMLLCQRRLVLAGDHHQLGPVVKSEAAAKGGLSRTLMDRITSRADAASLMLMLDQQYRMNDEIMTWTSKEFYDGRLQAPDEVKDRRLTQLKGVKATHLTRAPILFIDTAGCEMHEDEDDSAKSNPSQPSLFAQSKSNKHEVALILRHLRLLLADGVPLSSITVLSPYLAQLSLLRDLLLPLYPALEVGTIDSMQGRENDAILISMVRSNASGVVGFLSESRRMNVAITRAKAHVCVVGDSDTVTKDRFLHRLIDYISGNEQAEYISAMEYQDDGVVLEAKATPAPSVPLSASAAQPEIRTIKAAGATPAAKATSVGTEAAAVGEQAAAPVVETFDRERITRLCEEVLTGALPSFIFPASLSVDDRRVVHEVADEVGQGALQHLSEGRKHKRVITLRKQSPPAAVSTALPLPARPAAPATSSKSSAPSASSSARAKSGGRATGAAPSFSSIGESRRVENGCARSDGGCGQTSPGEGPRAGRGGSSSRSTGLHSVRSAGDGDVLQRSAGQRRRRGGRGGDEAGRG